MTDIQIRALIESKISYLLEQNVSPEEILFLSKSLTYKLDSAPSSLQQEMLNKINTLVTNYVGLNTAKYILYLKSSINMPINTNLSNKYSNII